MSAAWRPGGWFGCWRVARLVQPYLDGELDDAAAARVARHLQGCPRCARRAEIYRAIKTSLSRRRDTPQRLRDFAENLRQEPEE